MIGPHESAFWATYHPLVLVGLAAVLEPLRVALIAVFYEVVISRPGARLDAGPTDGILEADRDARSFAGLAGDHEHERASSVVGNEKDGEEPVRG